jgi:hypothetical protein
MGAPTQWEATERIAWTEHDGPDRPPQGVTPIIGFGVAAILSGLFTLMVLADDLCPEHRIWVQVLGGAALFGCASAAVALARGWSSAALIAVGTTLCGIVIGVIGVDHDPTRGWLITAAFTVAFLGAVWIWLRQLGVQQWQREQGSGLATEPMEVVATTRSADGTSSQAAPTAPLDARVQ